MPIYLYVEIPLPDLSWLNSSQVLNPFSDFILFAENNESNGHNVIGGGDSENGNESDLSDDELDRNGKYKNQKFENGGSCHSKADDHVSLPYNRDVHESTDFDSTILYPSNSRHFEEMLSHMEAHDALHHIQDGISGGRGGGSLSAQEKDRIFTIINNR